MPWLEMLRCIGCRGGGLREGGAVLDCLNCGRSYPVQADVPVMMDGAAPFRGPLLELAAARAILARLDVPADPFSTLRARRASGARVTVGPAADALPDDGDLLGRPRAFASGVADGAPAVEWVQNFVPRAMQPGQEMLANVRFRNVGAAAMLWAGSGRLTIAARWEGGDAGEVRTPLPVDVPPAGSLTVPVRLVAPASPGVHHLTLAMVQEGVRWLEPSLGPFRVKVAPGAGFAAPAHWVVDGPGPHDPQEQREAGIGTLRSWLSALVNPCVMEVCGGARPAVLELGVPAWNVDGDLLALQLGRMVPRADTGVLPVCADLADLPLPSGRFGAVVCFGTLHHQHDPAAVLRSLRDLLRPGGFIGLFCEPVGQLWPGAASPAVLAELRRGRNWQGFSLAEWAQMFGQGRLRADYLAVAGAAMTARLRAGDDDA